MNRNQRPTARKNDLVVQPIDGELLIYDLLTSTAKSLNPPIAFLWQKSDGTRSISDLAVELSSDFGGKISKEYVEFALSELSKHGLLAETYRSPSGFSRREAIRKIGMTSMVALPVIASLVAPEAISAQTCVPNNSVCTTSAQCCSGCCKNVGGGINECKAGGGACLP